MFIIILLLFNNFVISECERGCLRCDGKNNCVLCDAAGLFILIKDSCVKQDLQFCLLSFDLNACHTCMQGFYLEINQKCVQNPDKENEIKNCKQYSTFHRCMFCDKNYYLSENKRECLVVEKKIKDCMIYKDKNTCSSCSNGKLDILNKQCLKQEKNIPNCLFLYKEAYCQKCSTTHFLNENYYINNPNENYQLYMLHIQQFFMYQYTTLDLPICQKKETIVNCQSINPLNSNCTQCDDSYYLSQDQKSCLKNPLETKQIEFVTVPYCYKLEERKRTINNIQKTEQICVYCYEGYMLGLDQKKCTPHSQVINNCQVMSQIVPNECIKCAQGYYRAKVEKSVEKCHLRADNRNCKEPHELSLECKTCTDSTYIKHFQKRYCSPPIARCQTYNIDEEVLSCKFCERNYYFDINAKQCFQNTGSNFDPYCTLYNSNKECVKCISGFYYNKQTNECTTNDQEFINKSNCKEFDFVDKNNCIDCVNGETMLKVNMTCKLMADDLAILTAKDITQTGKIISNCKQFEMDSDFNLKCLLPLNQEESVRIEKCRSETDFTTNASDCKTYHVDTSDFLPVENDTTINDQKLLCLSYQELKSNSLSNVCIKCYDKVKITRTFSTDNMCKDITDIPYCSEDQRIGSQSQCVSPFGDCGIVIFDMDSTTLGNTNVMLDSCKTNDQRAIDPTTNVESLSGVTYSCRSSQTLSSGKIYCALFQGVDDCKGGKWIRETENDIVLIDGGICVENQKFPTDLCLKEKDGVCLLCDESYFPSQFKIFEFVKDKVETYASHETESGMNNCIVYNKETEKCSRCIEGYRLNPDSKNCVTCKQLGQVGSVDNLECYNYQFPSDDSGVCEQGHLVQNGNDTVYTCLRCQSGSIQRYKISQTIYKMIQYWKDEEKEDTFVPREIDEWAVDLCKTIDTNIFVSLPSNRDQRKYCMWGVGNKTQFHCKNCIFGFTGDYHKSADLIGFIEGCKEDTTCNSKVNIIIKEPEIRNFTSCQQCVEENKIITILFYYEKLFIDNTLMDYVYKTPGGEFLKTNYCKTKESYVPANCLIQVHLFNTDNMIALRYVLQIQTPSIELTLNKNNANSNTSHYACTTCKPKYKPTFIPFVDSAGTLYYPHQFTIKCEEIQYCKTSLVANICEQCNTGYHLTTNNTKCEAFNTSTQGDFFSCNVYDSVQNTCTTCKDGFVKTDKCVPYVVDECKYYQNDQCLQSVVKMGTNFSILYRQISTEYQVKQTTCVKATKIITNCKFYRPDENCMICNDGFLLKSDFTECAKLVIPNCLEYKFVNQYIECSKCILGQRIQKGEIQPDLASSLKIQTNLCQEDTFSVSVKGCKTQSEGFCVECTDEGYYPIKINQNTSTLCVEINFSKLCEEYDLEELVNNQTLSCKKCKKISEIIIDVNGIVNSSNTITQQSKYKLDQFDFINIQDFDNSVSKSGQIQYTQILANYKDIRAGLYRNNGLEYCRKYKGTLNCDVHDDTSLDRTFFCTKCNNATYYLNIKECSLRDLVENPNCIDFFETKDVCRTQFNSSEFVISYSSFDLFLIEKGPPKYSQNKIQAVVIQNCQIYASLQACWNCQQGFYLYDNLCLAVKQKVSDCERYLTDGICEKCTDTFLLFQNKCLIKYAKNCQEFLNNTKCQQCSIEFPILLQNGYCSKSENVKNCKIYSNINNCLKCEDNFYNQKGQCIPIGLNFIAFCEFQIDGNICIQCQENYTLSENSKECEENPKYERNCQLFSNDTKCSFCDIGYFMRDNYCYVCLTDYEKCMFCNPLKSDQCLQCRQGYFMNNSFQCIMDNNYIHSRVRIINEIEDYRQDLEFEIKTDYF